MDGRLARLQAIEDNHATITPLLPNLKADTVAWMQNCYTRYSNKRSTAGVSSNMRKSGTEEKDLALRTLRNQLLLAKEHVAANFNDEPARRSDYGVDGVLPHAASALQELADTVIRVHTTHKAQTLGDVMPDDQIQDLQDAKDALHNALQNNTDRKSGKDNAYDEMQSLFDEDTLMLGKLLAAWHRTFGYEDTRITLVDMVNTQRGGNPGKPGVPTIVIDSHDRALVITPDSKRPAPTSYQTQFREGGHGTEWEEFVTGSDTHIPTAIPLLNGGTEYEFRSRARNAHGYSEWSQVVVRIG